MAARLDGLVWALDRAQGELFDGRELSGTERQRLVSRLLEARVSSGRSAGYFVPGGAAEPMRLFTGEPIRTRLARIQSFSQEAARMLHLLGGEDPSVQQAVRATSKRLTETCYALQHCTIGECAIGFIGYVRFLQTVEGDRASSELAWRLQTLSQHRTGSGRWQRFPFYYTLLVLLEVGGAASRSELHFALPACIRASKFRGEDEVIAARRARILHEAVCRAQGSIS